MHYFHGRIIENVRISNKADAYVTNGWAPAGTHTDLVDAYRNPTGNPAILGHYTRPLYVAVKLRAKVMPVGTGTVADIFLVNEANLRGRHTLQLAFETPDGAVTAIGTYPADIPGGEEFGQLLVEGVGLPSVKAGGYHILRAELLDRNGTVRATGYDDIYAVDLASGPGIRGTAAVIDTSGAVNAFLRETRGIELPDFDPEGPPVNLLVVGAHDFARALAMGRRSNARPMDTMLDRVADGMTLVVLDQPDKWALRMGSSLRYDGAEHWGNNGRFFVGKHPLLAGLPECREMNWEYQVFYRGDAWGLDIDPKSADIVVGLASVMNDRFLCGLCRIPFGNGQVLLATLPLLTEITSPSPQSAAAKRLMLNIVESVRPTHGSGR
jgi:hypothetical protein